jgi:Cof subfamily protein (haloacid dehalogenase superfamily)
MMVNGGQWLTVRAAQEALMSVTGRPPRLIATDLDGTLLRPDGSVSERTRRVLSVLSEVGIELVLVTARPPRWVEQFADLVGAHGTVICCNGAFIYDVPRRTVIRAHGMSPSMVRAIAAELRTALPGVGFAAELPEGIRMEREYPSLHPEDVPADGAYWSVEAIDRPVGKLLARSLLVPEAEFLLRVTRIAGGVAEVTYSAFGGVAEIGPLGVTKGSSLVEWCTGRGISAGDVWAFGDMPNDLPMLTWAGVSFAVANAHPDVAAAASQRCPPNGEDGVACVLESLLSGFPGT